MASILYLHGFASGPSSAKAQRTLAWAREHGIPITIPDLNGAGFLTLTISSQLAIARAALATLEGPVVAVGSSLGGYLTALLQHEGAPIHAALLMAPAFDFTRRLARRMGPAAFDTWKKHGRVKVHHHSEGADTEVEFGLVEDARNYATFPAMDIPCTIVHGRADVDVFVEQSRLYVRENPSVKLVEMEDDHGLLASMPTVLEELARLVERVAQQASHP